MSDVASANEHGRNRGAVTFVTIRTFFLEYSAEPTSKVRKQGSDLLVSLTTIFQNQACEVWPQAWTVPSQERLTE
ncbi:MAG: hypothetical protein ACR2QJ_17545 [Geminicoccaceae bacterium]